MVPDGILAALTYPDIDPVLVEFGPIAIRWYSLSYIAGLLLGWWYVRDLAQRKKAPVTRQQIDDFLLWATFGVIAGGRLGYVLFYKPGFYFTNPSEILQVWDGGMSFHGGLLGVILAMWLFAQRHKIPLFRFTDLIATAAPIGLFLGRVANFINGELWGRATDVPWAMVFPGAGPYPRHPSQLYEAFGEGLVLFGLLFYLARRADALQRPGLCSGVFVLGYGLARFLVEFVREPDAHLGPVIGFATMGQILTIPMIALGLWLIWQATPSRDSGTRRRAGDTAGK